MALFRSVFPAERFEGFDAVLRRLSSVTQALREMGVPDYIRLETRIDAEAALPLQAVRLHIREGAPLIVTRAINADPAGKPVEYGITSFVAERVSLVMRPEGGARANAAVPQSGSRPNQARSGWPDLHASRQNRG
ncbi:UTRA domain-containing protein [Paracoccus cavernae]|uniref:UTRA domain-containing protein n=1 Tax=Paracoccus cavernae TaxID=1571207 RepID=UPI0036387AC0